MDDGKISDVIDMVLNEILAALAIGARHDAVK